jgi:hypothetical protein
MIEGFFKVVKHRLGLARFGQSTLLGVYRWLILSLTAYFLAHLTDLDSGATTLPDWGQAARLAQETLWPDWVVLELLIQIKQNQQLARRQGFDLSIRSWMYG